VPTIVIDTPAATGAARRSVAVRLTRWFARHGVTPAHVVVRFTETAPGTVFSGGFPVDALPAADGPFRHAAVTCCLGPDRDDEFRSELATEIAAALGPVSFLYIEFRPTPPSQVVIGSAAGLTRADRTTPREKVR
jgi:phenylpyruvate tautomerase PptA (4-oxalocrotonate tautomerase family)